MLRNLLDKDRLLMKNRIINKRVMEKRQNVPHARRKSC